MKNVWILTEERPKFSVIKDILRNLEHNLKIKLNFEKKEIEIRPIFVNKKFIFKYKLINCSLHGYKNIFLKIASGYSSFVDFLVFIQEKQPEPSDMLKNCVSAYEETKTDSKESRNTAAGQRSTKFFFLDYYKKLSNSDTISYMLYNASDKQSNVDPDSVFFIKRCLKTLSINFIGQKAKNLTPFKSVDELIENKNSMRLPPKGNVPIRIKKNGEIIFISGILSKPKIKGNIGHDPNQGQLIIISSTLRKLGWNKKIIITDHFVKQNIINKSYKGNKFIYAMQILNIKLQGIDIKKTNIPKFYWKYDYVNEKVSTILLHILAINLNFHCIYDNHGGCERGYFWTIEKKEFFAINKKFEGRNINIPDFVFADFNSKEIFIIEGKTEKNLDQGIKELEYFDLFENLYLKKYYPNFTYSRWVALSNGKSININKKVLFQLNTNGDLFYNQSLPELMKSYIELISKNGN